MADYKIIYRAEGADILWEPGCPVVLSAVQVSRNTETSATWLQVKAHNVSDRIVDSIYASLTLEYPDGTNETVALEFLDADIPVGGESVLKPQRLPRSDISSCSLTVTRLNCQGNAWGSSEDSCPLPERKKLDLSSRALGQRARAIGSEAGDSALHGKVQDHGSWWVCACGQINVGCGSCCVCGSDKRLLTANEDEGALLAGADSYEAEVLAKVGELEKAGTIDSLTDAVEKLESLDANEKVSGHLAACKEKLAALTKARQKKQVRIGGAIAAVAVIAFAAALVVKQVVIPMQKNAAAEAARQEAEAAAEATKQEIIDRVGAIEFRVIAENGYAKLQVKGDTSGIYAKAGWNGSPHSILKLENAGGEDEEWQTVDKRSADAGTTLRCNVTYGGSFMGSKDWLEWSDSVTV